jgi:HEPN domain-containing protein
LEKTLVEVVSKLNDQERSDFLLALVKTGDRVGKFIDTTQQLKRRQRKSLPGQGEKLPKEGVQHFLTAIHNSSQDLERMMDTASKLLSRELGNYQSVAAMAGEDLSILIKEVSRRLEGSGGAGGKELSGFLSTAARSVQNVTILISTIQDVFEGACSKILAYLNAHDSGAEVANFISMMDAAGERFISTDMDRAKGLTGEDKKNLHGTVAPRVEDRGEDQLGDPVAIAHGLDPADRNVFLRMASGAAETTGELLEVISAVTRAEQKSFLGVGSHLGGNDLKNFIRSAKTAVTSSPAGTFSNLVGLTLDLTGSDREYFLEASATAEPGVLSDLMNITTALGEKLMEKREEHPCDNRIALARSSFLTVASDAGHNLEPLIRMTETLMATGGGAFLELLDSAAKTGKYLGGFIQAYV